MTTEATPVAMEVWRKARSAWRNYPFTNIDDPADADHQAAAAVIATALADMQRRVEALEQAAHMAKLALGSHGYCPACCQAHAFLTNPTTNLALSDKTQEKNDG